jgi:predicted glycosyltransferase
VSKILFYCQSSLGIGHMVRSLRIAGGLARHFEVHFLNGGERLAELEVPMGVDLIQLPPITSDAEFTRLLPMTPGLSLEETFDQRRAMMMEACERLSPDILLVELYPFGRGQFSTELKPLLKLARRQGARVACSLRDILVARSDPEAYERKAVDNMNRFFDLLLVHSDPAFQRLDASFSRLADIRAPVRYTGYVVPEITTQAGEREQCIIASIGGGRFGHELAEAVVRAAPLLDGCIPHRIQLYTGPFCPDTVAARLHELAAGRQNIEVQRFTPDLHRKLQTAALSISMGGYNTTMNILATGVRAMMMGCTNNDGMDQVERVEKLARLGVIHSIRPEDLEPAIFADRVVHCLAAEPARTTLDINGVDATATELYALLEPENTNELGSTHQCLA